LVFPYFDGQLVFSAEGEQVVLRDEYSPASAGRGGMSMPRAIEPGRTLEFPIFFQSYYGSLAPGSHTLRYTVDVPCLSQSQGLNTRSSSGTFSILVEPEDREKLRKIITEYSEALDKGDPAALEALLSMDTPLVIPELKKLLDGSNWQRAFQTLSRFKGNDEAEQMALEALHAKLPAGQVASLGILSKWKREIPSEDVKALLASPSRDVRIAALHYVQALNDAKYLSLIAPLVSDPDGTVADEARRTMELLKKAQSKPGC
jgi:hypothetical protein